MRDDFVDMIFMDRIFITSKRRKLSGNLDCIVAIEKAEIFVASYEWKWIVKDIL